MCAQSPAKQQMSYGYLMQEPGALDALGPDGLLAWAQTVRRAYDAAVPDPLQSIVAPVAEASMDSVATVDWMALPLRVAECLTRAKALEACDWLGPSGWEGRARLQEEYAEWRVLRGRDGAMLRFEMTTELQEYWRVFAAYDPAATLRTVAELSGDRQVDPAEVYGRTDPFASGSTPQERDVGFASKFLDRNNPSRYNSGECSLCCMVHRSNTLSALLELAATAAVAVPLECRDPSSGRRRYLTATESIALFSNAAQQGRASDPVLVERLTHLGAERRRICFDDPVGVYIVGIERERLRTPDGSVPPQSWFTFGRGAGSEQSPDGRARYQHLSIEIPDDAGFELGDLVDVATDQRICWGGQLADMVQLAVYLRIGPAKTENADDKTRIDPAVPAEPALGCSGIERHYNEFIASRG